MKEEGEALVADTEALIAEKVSEHPEFSGVKAGFFWIDAGDFSTFYAYLPADPRASYLQDLGFDVVVDEPAHTVRVTGLGGRIPKETAAINVGSANLSVIPIPCKS